jgi:maltose phosphorylase
MYVLTCSQRYLLTMEEVEAEFSKEVLDEKVIFSYTQKAKKGEIVSIQKFAGYVTDMNHKGETFQRSKKCYS